MRGMTSVAEIVADEDGEVVVLEFGPVFGGGDHVVGCLIWRKSRCGEKGRRQPIFAEEISVGVAGFDEAIGVEQEAISWLERERDFGVGCELGGGQQEAVFRDFGYGAVAEHEHGGMSGSGITERAGFSVEMHAGSGDILPLCIATKGCIHACK